jgi:hypothetical protein
VQDGRRGGEGIREDVGRVFAVVVVGDDSMGEEVENYTEVGVTSDSGKPPCVFPEVNAACVLDCKLNCMTG